MTTSYRAAMLLIFIFSSCGKDNTSPQNENPITKEDLLGVYLVVEYGYSDPSFYGEKSYLQLVTFTADPEGPRSNNYQNDITYRSFINEPEYASATGITTFNVGNSIFLRLKRNADGEIILADMPTYRYDTYRMLHAELYTVADAPQLSTNGFQMIAGGNGYYLFDNGKWQYRGSDNFSTLDWDYDPILSFAWRGMDRGTAGYFNFGVTIPEGKGWKGQHKDEKLMLLYYADNMVSLSGVVICKMLLG